MQSVKTEDEGRKPLYAVIVTTTKRGRVIKVASDSAALSQEYEKLEPNNYRVENFDMEHGGPYGFPRHETWGELPSWVKGKFMRRFDKDDIIVKERVRKQN